jgi:hypothetical protein
MDQLQTEYAILQVGADTLLSQYTVAAGLPGREQRSAGCSLPGLLGPPPGVCLQQSLVGCYQICWLLIQLVELWQAAVYVLAVLLVVLRTSAMRMWLRQHC